MSKYIRLKSFNNGYIRAANAGFLKIILLNLLKVVLEVESRAR